MRLQIRDGDRAIVMAPSLEVAHQVTTWDGSSPIDYALELTISPSSKSSYRLLNEGAGPLLKDATLRGPTGDATYGSGTKLSTLAGVTSAALGEAEARL